MKQIINTLDLFLRQSWISLGAIILVFVFFQWVIFSELAFYLEFNDPKWHDYVKTLSITLNSIISFFVAIYISGGFVRLQQSYLWRSHPKYRMNLIVSLILAATIVGIFQSYSLFVAGWSWYMSLLAPICIILLSSHALAGGHLVMKIILPISPYIIFQLKTFSVSYDFILLLLLTITLISVYLLQGYKVHNNKKYHFLTGDFKQIMNNPTLKNMNNNAADLFSKFGVELKPNDLTTAIIHPIGRFGIPAWWTTILMLILSYIIDQEKLSIAVFGTLILAVMLMGVSAQIQLLSQKTKPAIHVFAKNQHSQLKRSILKVVDRQVLLQTSLYLIIVNIVSFLVLDTNAPELFNRAAITVCLVAIAFLPVMQRLNWFKVNVKLLFIMLSYATICFVFVRWHFYHLWQELLSLPVFLTLFSLVAIRLFSTYLWKRQSIEIFMRAYG